MSKLVLFLADGTTLDIPLRRERMTVGRRADNEICLPNLAVSGEHAAVVTILADSFLEDLGSTNGTLVNGQPIAKHFLRDGDQIDIGRHILVYCADDDTVLAPDFVQKPAPAAAGDLGERVEPVKPSTRGSGQAVVERTRRNRATDGAAGSQPATAVADPAPAGAGVEPANPVPRTPTAPPPVASVKVLSGRDAGRAIPLTKPQTTIGRAGVQVALISRAGDSFDVKPIEGDRSPLLNGNVLAAGGAALSSGDVIEIAGARLEFVGLPQPVDAR
jgi:pSer/pThr/pTyr-binding forkhead associated (FHA) protein